MAGSAIPMPPQTQYTRNGEISLAYQVFGEGPRDLVLTTGWVPSIETFWTDPPYVRFLERLGSFARVILWDKRGTGASDRMGDRLPTLEERASDLAAVMDAAGSERAAHFGLSEGVYLAFLFAAMRPERVSALIGYGGWLRTLPDDDYFVTRSPEMMDAFIAHVEANWADMRPLLALWAPSRADDEAFAEGWARSLRLGASPSAALTWLRLGSQVDARSALPGISAPTLLLHRTRDPLVPVESSRWIADNLPGSRLVELPGEDHLWWVGEPDVLLDEVEEFLTGVRSVREPTRRLATVLFTDVVGSTRRVAEIGDRAWDELLQRHDEQVRRQLHRHSGREIKTLGDGFFATFDGPARAIHCACDIREATRSLGIDIRAGVHTGECEVVDDDLRGLAVHIGARVGAAAGPGEVLVSGTVKDLVIGSGLEFEERGRHELKGVPGEWPLYAVV